MKKNHRIQNRTFPKSNDVRPTIGVLSHEFADSRFWVGIVDAARQRNVGLIGFAGGILASPHGFEAQANVVFDLVNPATVDGLIVDSDVLCHYVGVPALHAFCAKYALPLVSSGVALAGIPSVLLDFAQGMHAVLAHLIEVHRHRRIAFIRGPVTSRTGEERYAAYQSALAAHGISFDPALVFPGTFYAPSGAEAVRLLFDERRLKVDALAAANDFMALDAVQALHARGVRVPEDLAVVGFDDMDETRASTPPLTTVNYQIYERSQRVMDLLLALLAGENVAEQTLLLPRLVVRESCGCPSAAIAPVVITANARKEPDPRQLAAQRDALLAEICQAVGVAGGHQQQVALLFDRMIAEVLHHASGGFLLAWQDILRQISATGGDLGWWQHGLSGLRRGLYPWFCSGQEQAQAEDVWQQARILLGEALERAQFARKIQVEQQFLRVRELSQRLITTFDVAELMNILACELPKIGIQSCYLAVYENPANPMAWARLILAYHPQGRMPLPAEGQRFPATQLIPPEYTPSERQLPLIVEALYFQETPLGFMVFEVGAGHHGLRKTDVRNDNPVRGEISSALQGALLIRRIREHAAQNARQQYILDTFMANVPDAIYFKDPESRFIRVNQALARTFGFDDPAMLLSKTDFDLFPAEQAQPRYAQEQTIMQTGQSVLGLEESDLEGRWILTTKMPLRDEHGAIIGTFGISRDITALKQTEQELRQYRDRLAELVAERTSELSRANEHLHDEIMERRQIQAELTRSNTRLHDEILERRRIELALRASEQQYRTLAENVTDGMMIVQNDRVVFANQVFARLLGRLPESLALADVFRLWRMTDPETASMPVSRQQAEMITPDGRTIWLDIEPTGIVWNGQPATLLTIHDITDRKLREQRLEDERARLQQENVSLKSTIKERYRFGGLIGKSAAMQQVYERIISAASADVNVLVCGESGVGKELIARTMHQVSVRKAQPFVPVNCASIPETLFEREFFGHRKGAFTGADRDTPGLFDRAHRGVLFLDEVTELTPGTQAKLLRVLQDGEYFPVGSNTPKQANVLIIAAMNKEPQTEIQAGRLRKDFFYRICVIEIDVPPLRERKDDLPLLIEAILDQSRRRQITVHGQIPSDFPTEQTMLPTDLVQALYQYEWPGNVRELHNVLQRYVATRDLSAVLPALGSSPRSRAQCAPEELPLDLTLSEAVKTLEKRLILEALTRTNHHVGKAVELLGMPRRTLERKMKRYQL